MNRDLRTVTGWIKARWGDGVGVPDAVHEAAVRLAGPRKAVKPEKRQRLTAKKENRADRTSRRAAVRDAAMFRDGECCVLCGVHNVERLLPLHMHHVIGRHDERVETVAMLCKGDHEGVNGVHGARPLDALTKLATWCLGHGYADAHAAVLRRIRKVIDTEARAPRAAGATR